MALPLMAEEEEGDGEDVLFQAPVVVLVPADVEAVMVAAEEGDADALTRALDNLRNDVNCEGEDGDRPLHLACLYGHLECVQILLTAGASMEVRDEDGGIPLHDACAGGYKEIVSLLLQSATSPEQIRRLLDAHDVDGDTPLHHASRGNHADVVQLLLDYGASPKVLNALSQSPADLADAGSITFHRLLESAQHQAADSACDQAS